MDASGTLPENINYAIKSVLVLDLIKRVPGLSTNCWKLTQVSASLRSWSRTCRKRRRWS